MNLQTIAEHTVDISLIKRDSKVLDLGARNFTWSKAMLEYVDEIYCVDADPSIPIPESPLKLIRGAVSLFDDKRAWLWMHGNGTGNKVVPSELKVRGHRYAEVKTITLKTISEIANVKMWDIVKFDIEGSEAGILLSLLEPIAKQISCEFHMHTGTQEETILKVIDHLRQWYTVAFIDKSEKHGCGMNYWDTLFILKDIPVGIGLQQHKSLAQIGDNQ